MQTTTTTTERFSCECSAAAKVLITGGYVIIEEPNTGLVLTVSARFYTKVEEHKLEALGSDSGVSSTFTIISPQFGTTSEYTVVLRDDNTLLLEKSTGNKFVESTLLYSLAFILQENREKTLERLKHSKYTITIRANNNFYSQTERLKERKLPVRSSSLEQIEPFSPVWRQNGEILKTGLGSSAALVASMVAALLHCFGVVDISKKSDAEFEKVHRLAQLCHSIAQDKLGSGFDICAAVFGSNVYKRFSPSYIAELMSKSSNYLSEGLNNDFAIKLHNELTTKQWDHQKEHFKLPAPLTLMLADVSAGSNTPSLVRKVLAWKEELIKREKFEGCAWQQLVALNKEVEKQFFRLIELSKEPEFSHCLERLSELPANQWTGSEVASLLVNLRTAFINIRENFSLLAGGTREESIIEPASQRELADATMAIPGVLFAGVPGAGGLDALFAICIHGNARKRVEDLWEQLNVCALSIEEDGEGLQLKS